MNDQGHAPPAGCVLVYLIGAIISGVAFFNMMAPSMIHAHWAPTVGDYIMTGFVATCAVIVWPLTWLMLGCVGIAMIRV